MQRKVGRFSESSRFSPHRSDHARSRRRLAFGNADFRVNGKIFATLGLEKEGYGVLLLTPEQQAGMVEDEPDIFSPVPGGWGRKGSTRVRLAKVAPDILKGRVAHRLAQKSPKALIQAVQVKRESEGARHAVPAEAHPSKLHLEDDRRMAQSYRTFTARAASSATIVSEISDCVIIPAFAQRESTAVSVGEKAVLVLNARNR